MKKVIFYLLIVPNYFSLLVSSIMDRNILAILTTVYLLVVGMYLMYFKSSRFITNSIFYINVLLLYPFLLVLLRKDVKPSMEDLVSKGLYMNLSSATISLASAIILCIAIIICVNYFTLNREILYFILIIFSLNKSLFSLYLHVENYLFDSIVYSCVLNILMITTPKSSRVIKWKKNKKLKKNDE